MSTHDIKVAGSRKAEAATDIRDTVYQLMYPAHAVTLATVSENAIPHATTVYCTIDESLNLYFATVTSGRKYHNLIACPVVAAAITDEKNLVTIQLVGNAEPLLEQPIEAKVLAELWRLRYRDSNWPMPPIKMYESRLANEIVVFRVTPTEMTYARFNSAPSGKYNPFFEQIL